MSPAERLRAYDAEVRARPRALPGFVVERADGVTLLAGAFNFVSHWDLSDRDAEQAVHRLANRFRSAGQGLIWDVHGHDRPETLEAILASNGLEGTQTTTFMSLDLAESFDHVLEIEVRPVRDLVGLGDFVRVTGDAFGHPDDWVFDTFRDQLDAKDDLLLVAYVEDQPVGCSRIEFPADTQFVALFGGGVSPGFRGRGIYRAMILARAAEARARGFRYLTTTARETSRPILEHLGFRPLTQVRRWMLVP